MTIPDTEHRTGLIHTVLSSAGVHISVALINIGLVPFIVQRVGREAYGVCGTGNDLGWRGWSIRSRRRRLYCKVHLGAAR